MPLFVFTWPAGIPLTLAVRRLYPRSQAAAYGCAAVLGPLTTAAATAGGLLGPIAVWIYAAILSLPAWFLLGYSHRACARRRRTQARNTGPRARVARYRTRQRASSGGSHMTMRRLLRRAARTTTP